MRDVLWGPCIPPPGQNLCLGALRTEGGAHRRCACKHTPTPSRRPPRARSPARGEGPPRFRGTRHKLWKENSGTQMLCGPHESSQSGTAEDTGKGDAVAARGSRRAGRVARLAAAEGLAGPTALTAPVSQALSHMGPQVRTSRSSLVEERRGEPPPCWTVEVQGRAKRGPWGPGPGFCQAVSPKDSARSHCPRNPSGPVLLRPPALRHLPSGV